ncbi:hypothetical protein CsatB_012474 [Cannabis sativa]
MIESEGELKETEPLQILVQSNGHWDDNRNYVDYESSGELISTKCTFEELMRIMMEELQCNHESTQLQLKYQLKEGGQPLQIKDDKSLLFYIKLLTKEVDFTRYPLCVNKTSNTAPPNQTMVWNNMIMESYENNAAQEDLQQPGNNTATTSKQQLSAQTMGSGEVDAFFLETVTVSSESTIQQPDNNREKTTAVDEDFDFTDYAKLVAAEMVQQLENNQEEEEEVDNTEMMIINDKRHETIEKGQIYKDKETLISTLCYFAIKKTFQYKVVKSCTKEYNIVCLDTNCKWSLKATKNGNTETFIIRSYEEEHTCAVTIRFGDQRQATSKLIADFVKPKFLNLKTKCSPADIKTEMKDKYGIKMNYMKAWRSKERAQTQLHGNAKESYNLLPRYLYMLQKTNPGTLIDIEKDDDDSFKYAFVALNAAIKGWPNCKPIIVVDGTFLKAAYGGTLLTANTQDAESKIFPLAYCIVDSENDKSWEWFLKKIREAFGVRECQCLISNRHESIIKATRKVFPEITHGYCIFHLLSNLKTKFKKNAKHFRVPFFAAAKAYTEMEFEFHMRELDNLDKRIRPYLEKIGHEKWSRYHSENNRYSTMTSNIAEALNSANLAARETPVTTLMECLRAQMQEWTYNNRKEAQKCTTRLTPSSEKKLIGNYVQSLRLTVKPANQNLFEVIDEDRTRIVNLKEKTCTCNRFQKDEMPCNHAVAVMKDLNINTYNYCAQYYTSKAWLQTYEETVYPVGNVREWELPDFFEEIIVLPPKERIKSGRPRKRRMAAAWETKKQNKCGKCGQKGHNKKTCRRITA